MGVSSLGGIVIPIVVVQTGDKRAVAKVDTDIKKLGTTVNRLTASTKKSTAATTQWTETQKRGAWGVDSVTRKMQKNVTLSNGMKGTLVTLTENGNNFNKTLNALRWSMVNFTFALTAIAGLAYPFVELAKYGMELESLFTKVEVVTGTSAEIAGKAIEELRQGTIFSMQEMGDSFLEFTKQGFDVQEAMMAMPAVTALSVAGFTNLTKAVEMVSQVLHAFNMDAEQSAHITDVLKNAANQSRASVEDFGVALSYAAPVASQAGVSFEEMSAALAILTNKGLTASKAGTSLAAMITQMLKPTDKTKAAMRKMGLSFFDAGGQLKDLDTITREWAYTLDDSEESLEFLMDSMGRRGARAMANFLKDIRDTGEGIQEFQQNIEDAESAQEGMEKVMNTSSANIKKLWEDLKVGFIDLSETVVGEVDKMVGSINKYQDANISGFIGDLLEVKGLLKDLKDGGKDVEEEESLIPFLDLLTDIDSLFGPTNDKLATMNDELKRIEDTTSKFKPQFKFVTDVIMGTGSFKKPEPEPEVKEAITTHLQGYKNQIEKGINDLVKDLQPKAIKDLDSLLPVFDDLLKQSDLAFGLGPTEQKSKQQSWIKDIINTIGDYKNKVFLLSDNIELVSLKVEEWQNITDDLTKSLKVEKAVLSDLKDELKDVNSEISLLSNPRFSGQLEVEKLISDIDRYMAKQEFMANTGITAQEFIQNALSSTSNSYDDLITSIDGVNNATNTSKDSYEAWRETVSEFIKDAVKQGNLLGKNVSGAVTKFSSLLLSTSKFGDSNKEQKDSVSYLKDAYDIYYGEMTDQVSYAVKEHEEGNRTIYDSAQPVIDALQEQWGKQTNLNTAIDASTSAIDSLSAELDDSKDKLSDYKDIVKELKEELDGVARAAKIAAKEALELNRPQETVPSSSSSSSFGGNDDGFSAPPTILEQIANEIANPPVSAPVPVFNQDTQSWDNLKDTGWTAMDFVSRPGMPAQKFSPDDTIIGVKDPSTLGGLSIGEININGVSGDPNEIASRIAEEIRMEMRLG